MSASSAPRSQILGVRLSSWQISGVHYSLQYLTLSDATMLTFLAPMCTAVTGAMLLVMHSCASSFYHQYMTCEPPLHV